MEEIKKLKRIFVWDEKAFSRRQHTLVWKWNPEFYRIQITCGDISMNSAVQYRAKQADNYGFITIWFVMKPFLKKTGLSCDDSDL
jgi:hypothetical protein